MTSVKELRQSLVNNGYSQEEADNIKGKDKLEQELKQIEDASTDLLDDLTEEAEREDVTGVVKKAEVEEVEEKVNILDYLTDKEKVNGHPTVNGLRRIINERFGWIASNVSKVIQCPDPSNENRATVTVEIDIECYNDKFLRTSGCADVCKYNTPSHFYRHPVATAESRAEGRAYRKALNLNIATAEEMGNFQDLTDDPIKDSQKAMITKVCSRCNINEDKFLASHNLDKETLSKVSSEEGKKLCSELNSYQSLNEVPEELLNES